MIVIVTREGADQSSVHDLWCVAWTAMMVRGGGAEGGAVAFRKEQ